MWVSMCLVPCLNDGACLPGNGVGMTVEGSGSSGGKMATSTFGITDEDGAMRTTGDENGIWGSAMRTHDGATSSEVVAIEGRVRPTPTQRREMRSSGQEMGARCRE